MDSTEGSAECLPIDFLRLLFGRLSARDLCSAACVCRLWNELTRECWRAKVQRRWKHGRGSARWRSFAQRGEWKRVYRERHLRDCAARAALRDLPWPVRREAALATLVAAGDETLDELLAAAVATTAPVSGAGPGPGSAATSGGGGGSGGLSEQGLRLRGPRLLGQRYWVEMALAALRKREAVAVLHRLARDPRVAEERPEAGALAIAQAHYPTADLSGVEAEVAALGRELRRRMDAEGAPPGSLHALRILNHLLFGPPPPPQSTPPPSQPSQPQPQATAHTATAPPAAAAAAAAAASGAALLATQLAGCDGGLGLRGCEVDDYYNPANSMLCDVLARRRGIPISLALLHLAVARRGGLGGRLELIGLPTRVVNRFVPTITTITTAPIAATADSVAAAAEGGAAGSSSSTTSSGGGGGDGGSRGGEGEEEVFIDVFGGGTRLSWSQLRSKMAGLGVPVQRGHVRALSPSQIYERMCANLYSIYRNAGDMTCLRLVLELCGAVAEQSRDLLIRRYRVGLALEDWSDAAECLDAMTAALTAPPAASGAALGAGTAGAPQPPPQQQGGLQQGQQQQPGQAGSAVGSAGGAAAEAGDGEDQHLRQQLAAHMSRLRRDLDERRSAWQSSSVSQKHRPPSVMFAVGTMMQHRKYGYRGVIVDWDLTCRMDEAWIKRMGVDSLPGGGRHQPFYRVLVSDRTRSSSSSGSGSGSSGAAAGGGAGGSSSGGGGGNDGCCYWGGDGGCPQVWRPEGAGSEMHGLHNRPRFEETYVAQINIQLAIPTLPPTPPSAAASAASAAASAGAASASGQAAAGGGRRLPAHYERLVALGVSMVTVPYDFEVDHPELGRYFESKTHGSFSYRLNAALRHRFPGDGWMGDGEEGGEGGEGGGGAWDWQGPDSDAWREGGGAVVD